MNRIFRNVRPANPGYSQFDLSYDKKLTCDMGELIPILADEVLPGDIWMIGNVGVIRAQPLVAPILHPIDVYFHYFFVPNRLIWTSWETFITGGQLGTDATALPRWAPSATAEGSLWDYMGMPVGVAPDADNRPIDFPKRAYNLVYNQFYRDENLISEIDITTAEAVQKRAWSKDFFTSSLPWTQRGTMPALPVTLSGIIGTSAVFPSSSILDGAASTPKTFAFENAGASSPYWYTGGSAANAKTNAVNYLNNNTVSVNLASGSATSFNINDFRLAMQLQRWMERNARAGYRYVEFIGAHFGPRASPRDERLQRPEYIGGSRSPVVVSEVLQTSATGITGGSTPHGNLAGHGIAVLKQFCAKFRAREHGIVIGIMSIMPKPVYQQGIDRQWLRKTRYDYYSPEFANLGEQAIQRVELYASTVKAENETVFGYQGRWDEYRTKKSMVCGELRTTLDHWHVSRQFGSAPTLNQTFVECNPRKDIFAAPSSDGWVCNIGNIIKAIRPMPVAAEPGIGR